MGNDHDRAHAEVSKEVCLPKKEGGLGLKRLEVWNQAAIMRHILLLFTRAGSLWVAWVLKYLLKGRSFWEVKVPQGSS